MPIISGFGNGSLRSYGTLIDRQKPVNLPGTGTIEYLVIGGGGSGGGPGNGGGGGSGGFQASPSYGVTPLLQYTIRVGGGGGGNGTNSGIFATVSGAAVSWARGGGSGGGQNAPGNGMWGGPYPPANPDGYGGGGGGGNRPLGGVPPLGPGDYTFGGYASDQGRNGGGGGKTPTNTGPLGHDGEPQYGGGGGGGGGASGAGENGGDTVTSYLYGGSYPAPSTPDSIKYASAWGGNGGNGTTSTITGATLGYSGGGGGGGDGGTNQTNIHAVGGLGGGGGGAAPNSPVGRRQYANPSGVLTGGHPGNGDAYTGGGGGAGGTSGASGVVIIRYPLSYARANAFLVSGSPIYSEDASYRYYTFQGSGTIGFSPGTSIDP
jgi:hypothetical protein